MTSPITNHIVLDPTSRLWRSRLGALPWTVLEVLALSAVPTTEGWTARVGVRDLGASLGITKDTAARAVATLRSAGLVLAVRVPVEGGSRPGDRLNLPEGISVHQRGLDRKTFSTATATTVLIGKPPGVQVR